MKRRLWIVILVVIALLLGGGGWIWTQARSCESNQLVDLSWSQGGQPMAVHIILQGPNTKPLPGVHVDTISGSGRAGNTNVTDKFGSVIIRPGELELIGLDVNGVHVFDRDHLFAPSIAGGLKIKVVVKNPKELNMKGIEPQN